MLSALLPDDLVARLPRTSGLPTADDRAYWQALARAQPHAVAFLHAEAAAVRASPIPDLPLAGIAAFWPTGDRVGHERPYFARRRRLACLCLAEALAHDGSHLDAIAEHLWAIISEPLWVLPAHAGYRRGALDQSAWIDPVPEPGWEGVDLFAAETAQVLAECVELLRTPLEQKSLSLVHWVQRTVVDRVVAPVAAAALWDASTPMTKWRRWPWWMFAPRNNWTPWCAAGVLAAALILDDDRARVAVVVRRLVAALDGYLAAQPADGSCDEGPGYWNVSAGQLLWALELLAPVLPDAVWRAPLLAALARYPAAVHVGGDRFATVADARPLARPRRELLWRWGTRTHEPRLTALVSALPDAGLEDATGGQLPLWRRALAWLPAALPDAPATAAGDDWLSGVQLLVRRAAGVALVAKGGHNDENHNHNDLGHVALAVDGRPLVLDVGIGTYDRSTFGSERYGSWLTRGAGHNAAVINGVEQQHGRAYAAQVERVADGVEFDLTAAYPAAAGITSYRRSARLAADGTATIADALDVRAPWSAAITLYTPAAVERDGDALVLDPGTGRGLHLALSGDLVVAAVEEIALTDPLLIAGYGPTLLRIALRGSGTTPRATWTLTATPFSR